MKSTWDMLPNISEVGRAEKMEPQRARSSMGVSVYWGHYPTWRFLNGCVHRSRGRGMRCRWQRRVWKVRFRKGGILKEKLPPALEVSKMYTEDGM